MKMLWVKYSLGDDDTPAPRPVNEMSASFMFDPFGSANAIIDRLKKEIRTLRKDMLKWKEEKEVLELKVDVLQKLAASSEKLALQEKEEKFVLVREVNMLKKSLWKTQDELKKRPSLETIMNQVEESQRKIFEERQKVLEKEKERKKKEAFEIIWKAINEI